MSKIRVLYIHHGNSWGGALISMLNLIKALDPQKFDAKVLLIKHSMVAEKLKENNISYAIAESNFYKNFYTYLRHSEAGYIKWYEFLKFLKCLTFWVLSHFYFAKRELAKHNFDVVHMNSSGLTDWLAPAKKMGKTIIHIREPFRKGKIDVLRPVLRSQMRKYADHIVAISNDNARRVNLLYKTTVIYNHAESSEEVSIESSYESRKVLYLGGTASIKGYFTMVEALDHLDDGVQVYFGGNFSSNLKQKSLKGKIKQIAKRILRRKHLAAISKMYNHPNAVVVGLTYNVSDYLNKACCLASPFSVPHFARPIIEAYLHKKPVIGSDVEGMDEIIEHEVTGLIIPRNNPKALAEAINDIATTPLKGKKFGEAGYGVAMQKFTDSNIAGLEKIYQKVSPK